MFVTLQRFALFVLQGEYFIEFLINYEFIFM